MNDTMTLFKRIEIDLEAERARITRTGYTRKQRAALIKLVDLFEEGKFQECLDHINDKKAFPYNKKYEYPEVEHVGIEIGDALRGMADFNYYTRDQLLEEARIKLESTPTPIEELRTRHGLKN
jgi:hypothetical protein